jgi:hypothetical protein
MANSTNYKPLSTGYTRSFLIEGRARGDHSPVYASQMRMTAPTQPFGDITNIEIPDPANYNKWLIVDKIQASEGRVTFSLEQKYAAAVKSALLRLAKARCAMDIQLHIGECTDPSLFNTFTKALIIEDASIGSWKADDLGALGGDQAAAVNETADLSASNIYEVMPLSFGEKGGDVVTNKLLDGTICDNASCGVCATESDGCKKIYAVSTAAGGSVSTPPDVVFSVDKGATWKAHDVDTMLTGEIPGGIACTGLYTVVFSHTTPALHYALKSEFESGVDPVFTKVSTGFVAAPNAAVAINGKIFVVGEGGYVYWTDDPTAGVTVLDAGVATVDDLNCVHAIDEDHAVAVGNNGAVIFTTNRTSWAKTNAPVGVGIHLLGVWMKSKTEWWVSTSNGYLWYTLNSGSTWTRKSVAGTQPTTITSIKFSTASVAFASGVVSSKGRLWRSFNGGYDWVILPESGSMVAADEFTHVIVCPFDPDFVVGIGLADNAADGIIVIGAPA